MKALGQIAAKNQTFATTLNQLARMKQALDAGIFTSRSEMVRAAVVFFQTTDVAWEEGNEQGVCKHTVSFVLAAYWSDKLPNEQVSATIRRSMNRLLEWCAPLLENPIPRIMPPDPVEVKKKKRRAYIKAHYAAARLTKKEYMRAYREEHPVKYVSNTTRVYKKHVPLGNIYWDEVKE